jgi:hypothetical protein
VKRPTIDLRFYETYNFAFAVKNILSDQFSYIRHLDGFYGDGKYLRFSKPFPKYSAFHEFLEFVIEELLTDPSENYDLDGRHISGKILGAANLQNVRAPILPIERALRHHGYEFETFGEWLRQNSIPNGLTDQDHIYDYLNELRLSGPYEDLLVHCVREVFFLLFANRQVLLLFNDMISRQMADTSLDEVDEEHLKYFARDGALKRCNVPEWVRRAVFYRDRGLCVVCHTDLSGILNIYSEDHFDHIVPLAGGGLNDVTNMQLLCSRCNNRKSDGDAITSNSYEDWYPLP